VEKLHGKGSVVVGSAHLDMPQVELIRCEALVPYARNSRTHSADQKAKVKALIRGLGFWGAVMFDTEGLCFGHLRREAVMEMHADGEAVKFPNGYVIPAGFIPAMRCDGWSPEQRKAAIIADNRAALDAGWDEDMLRLELVDLEAAGFDIALTAFDGEELARLLKSGTEGLTDPDDAPPLPEVPVTVSGDVWLLGGHRVVCGDSTKADAVKAALGRERPSLMVTDPPGGVVIDPVGRVREGVSGAGAARGKVMNDDRADWREAWALFPGAVAYVWHGGLHAGAVATSLIASKLLPRAQIIWVKSRLVIGRGAYHWQHEPCYVAVKEGREPKVIKFEPDHEVSTYAVRTGETAQWEGGRKQSTVWEIEHLKSDTGHGTQKPVECMRRPIVNNSPPGGVVYDPFLGSGTTLIAAEMEGRTAVGLELDPAYVDVIVKRWQAFTGRVATLEASGRSFEEVEAERANQSKPSRRAAGGSGRGRRAAGA
jgi:DNA modification methylase